MSYQHSRDTFTRVHPFARDLPRPHSPRLRRMLEANLRLLALADRLRDHWSLTARRHGLSATQIKVMLTLAMDEPTMMRTLAGRLGYDASNLTSLVDRLERDGLVRRHVRESDRRVTELTLTAEGRRIRDDFWTTLNAGGPLDALSTRRLTELDGAFREALQSLGTGAATTSRGPAQAPARASRPTSARPEPPTSRRSSRRE